MQPGGNKERTKEILENTEILKSRNIYIIYISISVSLTSLSEPWCKTFPNGSSLGAASETASPLVKHSAALYTSPWQLYNSDRLEVDESVNKRQSLCGVPEGYACRMVI